MMLDWKHKVMLGLLAAGLLGGVLGFRTWLSEHDSKLQAQAQVKAAEAVQAQAQSQMAALAKQMADRDAQYQSQLQTLDTKFSRAATPDQLAQLVSQLMGLKAPIAVVTPAASDGNAHPAPIAQVPQIDFPQAKSYIETCESCKLSLDKSAKDLKDRETQMQLAQKQIDSLKTERDAALKVANGGTFWIRLKRASHWFIIGAAAGTAAICSTGHCR